MPITPQLQINPYYQESLTIVLNAFTNNKASISEELWEVLLSHTRLPRPGFDIYLDDLSRFLRASREDARTPFLNEYITNPSFIALNRAIKDLAEWRTPPPPLLNKPSGKTIEVEK